MCKLSWMPNTFEVDNSIIWAIWLIAAYLIGIINHVLTSRIWNKTRNSHDFLAETLQNLKSASNLNGNLNCSKELEHYAS